MVPAARDLADRESRPAAVKLATDRGGGPGRRRLVDGPRRATYIVSCSRSEAMLRSKTS